MNSSMQNELDISLLKQRIQFKFKLFFIVGVLFFSLATPALITQSSATTSTNNSLDRKPVHLATDRKKPLHPKKKIIKKRYICNPNANLYGYKAYLVIPSIKLIAPVVEGTNDPQLNVAAGHDPSSVWPGQPGTAVLQAHDVSFFVNIDKLKSGSVVYYETPCYSYTFVVHSASVIQAGSPVYNTSNATMVLVTCWPTNALYFTNSRYIVDLIEVKARAVIKMPKPLEKKFPYQPPPGVPVPQPLAAQGLTLITNSIPMGLMTIGGRPSPLWIESPGPLNIEASALADYIGSYKALDEGQVTWWKMIAPTLNPPAQFEGYSTIEYLSPMNVTAEAQGTKATVAILSTAVSITGGRDPGRYNLRVVTTIERGKLYITSWIMTPA
ncbi:MAG: class D sortase [Firmicutes bacterium]|nr:class D sortase [Bacillota bacterium]